MIQILSASRLPSIRLLMPIKTQGWRLTSILNIALKTRRKYKHNCPKTIVSQGPVLFSISFLAFPAKRHIIHVHNSYVYDKPHVRILTILCILASAEAWFVSPLLISTYPFLVRSIIAVKNNLRVVPPLWEEINSKSSHINDKINNLEPRSKPTILISSRYHPTKFLDEFAEWLLFENTVSCNFTVLTDTDLCLLFPGLKSISCFTQRLYTKENFIYESTRADFVATLSKAEGFCLTLVEGMQFGLIPLAPANSVGPEYIINQYQDELLYSHLDFKMLDSTAFAIYNDKSAFAEKLLWAFERQADLRKEISEIWTNVSFV